MGSVGGGVWKTTNYGQTWHNVSDGYFKRSPAMGALAIAPSDTSILYAGTGSDGLRSNVITGRGVYKSTDAGATWQFMGLQDAGQIGAVRVHPENPDLVYVAALGHPFGENPQRGVFRSKDGGETWEKVLYASDSTGAVDVELHPTDPSILYAAMWRVERKPWTIISEGRAGDGIYKSTDGGGETWRLVNGKDGLMHRPFYFTTLLAALEDVESALVTADTMNYPPPMLIDQLEYLSWMTSSADQQLGQDVFERFAELEARLDALLDRWTAIEQRVAALGMGVQMVGWG